MADSPNSNNLNWFSTIAKYIIFIIFSSVLAYKIIITPFQLNIDFLALLSLTLAIFSVGLSALFYFKATETSNAFYDNTFKYTKEIAELLVRIESGFGERLKNLADSYTYIQDKVMATHSIEDVGITQEKLTIVEQEFQQKLEERDKFIDALATKAKLDGDKKEEFLSELKNKDKELQSARIEIETLRNDLQSLEFDSKGKSSRFILVTEYINKKVIPMFKLPPYKELSSSFINKKWIESIDEIHPSFIHDMSLLGFSDNKGILRNRGIQFIMEQIRKNQENEEIPF